MASAKAGSTGLLAFQPEHDAKARVGVPQQGEGKAPTWHMRQD